MLKNRRLVPAGAVTIVLSLGLLLGHCSPMLVAAARADPAEPLPVQAGLDSDSASGDKPRMYGYRIKNVYPHDRYAFTQGLVFKDNYLFEGTGLHRRSSLRKVDLETGKLLRVLKLPARFFGEGITIYGDKIIQLTWRSNIGFVFDKTSFGLIGKFHYPTEGWGLTHDGRRLILSDGTSTLYFLDPETFQETGRVKVFDHRGPVTQLNELEYVRGEIYANVWKTDRIARISPDTGQVLGWIDLQGLLASKARAMGTDVLNGIAYDEKNDRLFVTGKLWPKLFEIELVPRQSPTP